MEPALVASLTSSVFSNLTSSAFADVASELSKLAQDAKKQHELLQTNPENPLEQTRRSCIQRLCNLQQDIVLYVTDPEFLKRVLPLSLDLTTNVYRATTAQELEILDMSISRIDNARKAYQADKQKRKKIRLLAVIVSLIGLGGIGLFIWGCLKKGVDPTATIPIIGLPLPVLLWSIIGSFAAIVYRFTHAGDSELREPIRWLFARPLTGVIMGAVAYLIMHVGLISIQGNQPVPELGSLEVMWLVAFLAGFSDRFSDYLLTNVVGKFGAKLDGDLMTLEMSNKVTSTESSRFPLINYLIPAYGDSKTNGRNLRKKEIPPVDEASIKAQKIEDVKSVSESNLKITAENHQE